MIENRVSRLCGERRENIKEMAAAAGISYGAAYDLYKGTTTRIDFKVLDKLCRHFGVTPCEILEYQPDPS
jgi:DNA-binding Xre family transcriptional regulator